MPLQGANTGLWTRLTILFIGVFDWMFEKGHSAFTAAGPDAR